MTLLLILIALLCLGVPVAWALGLASFLYMAWNGIPFTSLVTQTSSSLTNSILIAVPLYILAGEIMNNGGVTRRIIAFCSAIVGRIRGSLAQVNILASIVFSGMSGSAYADAAGLGTVLIKAMREQGYKPEYAAAVTAASSTIGPIIPPSIAMIVYGSLTGTSIGGLFLGGVVPGLLMGGAMMALAAWLAYRHEHPRQEAMSWEERGRAILDAVPSLLMPLIVIGGILSGVFTPTEAAAVAVIYASILAVIYHGGFDGGQFLSAIKATIRRSAGVMLVISFAAIFGWLAIRERIPFQIAAMIMEISDDPLVFLLLVNLLLLVLGMFLETIAVLLLVVPILFPMLGTFGISPVHFGVVVCLNLMIGLVTPPLGICLYIVSNIARVPLMAVVVAVLPFMVPLIAVLLLVTVFPAVVTFLPTLVGFR
ncbi:TRAP transporter large permease [Stappia indica]|uniref:TRAP transporter large permease n=1 Tax=Stappia indica TaxID=538381 RepID=UPI001D18C549|nr:TRAP transporter large permease [Stappia indica]MCC4246944.1 TRAP transporter large permease [Stappia indica]